MSEKKSFAEAKYKLTRALESVVGEIKTDGKESDGGIGFGERKAFHDPLSGILDILNFSLSKPHSSLASRLIGKDTYETEQIDSRFISNEKVSENTNTSKGIQTDNTITKIQDIECMYQSLQEELANTRNVVLLNQRNFLKKTVADSYSKITAKTKHLTQKAFYMIHQERTECQKEVDGFLSELITNHEEYFDSIVSLQKKEYDIEANLATESLLRSKRDARVIFEEFERALFRYANSASIIAKYYNSVNFIANSNPANGLNKTKDVVLGYDGSNELSKTKEILLGYEKTIVDLSLEIEELRLATIQVNFNLEPAIVSEDVNQEDENQEEDLDSDDEKPEDDEWAEQEKLALEVEKNQKKMKDLKDAQEVVLDSIRKNRKIEEAKWYEVLTRMSKINCLRKMKTVNSTKIVSDRQLRILSNVAKCKKKPLSNTASSQTEEGIDLKK